MMKSTAIRRAYPDGATLGSWEARDGWSLRRLDWPSDGGRGALLFQGGRGDVIEKYLEAFGHWHDRGWSVRAFDWRGQGGSGRLSPAPNVGHADSFVPWIDDLAEFYAAWTTGAGPHVVMGHSMGGHLVLRALLEARIDPDAVALVAPMLGLHSPIGARGGAALARMMTRLGDPARAAWKQNERPHSLKSREALLTHDHDRYVDEEWWYQAKPEIRLGPPSWAWLAEAFASTRAQQHDPRLLTLHTPIAMLVAEADGLVNPKAAIAVAAQLPDCDLVRFGPESAHEILREADPVRDRALAAIDAFLDAKAPPS